MNTTKINGKQITFRARLTVREAKELPRLLKAIEGEDVDSQVAALCQVVEAWDFVGSPSDPASYDDLDIFEEVVPLVMAAIEYINQKSKRTGAELKN